MFIFFLHYNFPVKLKAIYNDMSSHILYTLLDVWTPRPKTRTVQSLFARYIFFGSELVTKRKVSLEHTQTHT